MRILVISICILICCFVFLGFFHCTPPGTGNDPLETVAIPEFSVDEGIYDHDIEVEVTCATEGAAIYYTTDNSEPTSASAAYDNNPITVAGHNTSMTIRAFASKKGMNKSAVVSATYTIDNPPSDIKTWSKVIDRSCGISGLFETQDNCYITGGGESNGIYLIKFDNNGDIVWEKTFDGETEDRDKLVIYKADLDDPGKGIWNQAATHEGTWGFANPYYITNCQDGSIIMAGKINFDKPGSSSNQDIYILKFDAGGNHLWSRLFIGTGSEDVAWMIRECSDSGYIIGAQTNSNEIIGGGGYKNLIIKLDSAGNLEWTSVHGINGGVNFTYDVAEDDDGNFVIVGCDVMHRKSNIFKIAHTNGELLNWTAAIDENMRIFSILKVADGFLLSGEYRDQDSQRLNLSMVKLNVNGNVVWNKILTHDHNCCAVHGALQPAHNNGFVLAGYTREDIDADFDIIMYRLDSEANIIRARVHDNNGRDDRGYIVQSFDGGYIVAAETINEDVTPRDYDIWLIKLDEYGRLNP
jgi:hypothetical protein